MKGEQVLAKEPSITLTELRDVAARTSEFYYYKKLIKGKKIRVFRVPTGKLLRIQKSIKTKVLDPLALPATMHGWRRRHSTKTYVADHIHRKVVINIDLQDFYPSVSGGRVCTFWKSIGYSPGAARLLTALTVCDNQLPQGGKCSSLIGNQVLRHLDKRLHCLALLHDLRYSNYGDEITVSGRIRAVKLKKLLERIIEQEGFVVNPQKIKVRYQHERQELAGIVVNKKPSVGRDRYRDLRATLHNCLKYGPASQNRESHPKFKFHLLGRIGYVRNINRRLGERLLGEYRKIQWE